MNAPIESHLNDLAERVIAAAIEVHRYFGPGFAEQTYHKALAFELEDRGLSFVVESPVALVYKGRPIGHGRIDLLVENELVVELKATQAQASTYKKQVLTYLKATNLRLGLILNFEAVMLKDGLSRVAN